MEKQQILALTLARFGLCQDPPMEHETLESIDFFTRSLSETCNNNSVSEPNMSEIITSSVRVGSTASRFEREQRLEHENACILRILCEKTDRLRTVTVGDVLKSWRENLQKFAECEEIGWRYMQASTMGSLIFGLQRLEYPAEEIVELCASADFVLKGIPLAS